MIIRNLLILATCLAASALLGEPIEGALWALWPLIALAAGSGAAGTIAGALQKNESDQSQWVELGDASGLQNTIYGSGERGLMQNYDALFDLTQAGPGQEDVAAGVGASRSLADMLSSLQASGGLPDAQDIEQSNSIASGLFNARRNALSQSFEDQQDEFARLAARTGRSPADPVFQNMMRRGFMRQSDSLQAEQSDYANALAMEMPGRRLGFAAQRADVLGGLAGQAFRNRAAILSMGSSLGGAERAWQFRTGTHRGTAVTQGNPVANALQGGMAGVGAGLSMGSDLMTAFGSGGSAGAGRAPAGAVAPTASIPLGNPVNQGGKPGIMGFTGGQPLPSIYSNPIGPQPAPSFTSTPLGFNQWMNVGRPAY